MCKNCNSVSNKYYCSNRKEKHFQSNNIVIFGIVDYFKQWTHRHNRDPKLKPHVITSDVEHDSVILPLKRLEEVGDIGKNNETSFF